MKSKSNLNYDVTTNYIYSNSEQEYVFCYRARPFAMLSSSHFPTPTSSYVDHRLVMELGMKITDVGCKKLSFAGKKLRMLGKVSFTAQCVKDGQIFGNFQFKASVIEDLKYHFDTHGIVGVKMKYLLGGGAADRIQSSPSSSTNRTPPSSGRSTPTSPSPSSPTKSPGRSSPPGFPTKPSHQPPTRKPNPIIPPSTINLIKLTQMFGGADMKNDVAEEREILVNHDDEGREDTNQPQFVYVTSTNHHYASGHGRHKCRFDVCSTSWEVPENCGFMETWFFPQEFRPCSPGCRGAFCECINGYNND